MAENDAAVCVEVIGTGRRLDCCTHCRSESLVRNGSASGLQRHKCRGCGPTFSAVTGTPLARLRQKPKWLAQGEALRDGTTIRRVATLLKVARSTAFRWRHRFLALPKTVQAQALMGITEADETFFLRSRKGQRQLDQNHVGAAVEPPSGACPSNGFRFWWPAIARVRPPLSSWPLTGWRISSPRSNLCFPRTRSYAQIAVAYWPPPSKRFE